jgi:AraC family transcriptional regulator of adaptative response/methylated-DNA-[protein]-cysteine methyltransferase
MVNNLYYGFYNAPYGKCCLAFNGDGIFALFFHEDDNSALDDLRKRFSGYQFIENQLEAVKLGESIFIRRENIKLHLTGTEFQLKVWHALMDVPSGQLTHYAEIANRINKPKAVRAVGTAVGANPLAWIIPCHRVIRADGKPGGYRWGLPLKKMMLEEEGITCNW